MDEALEELKNRLDKKITFFRIIERKHSTL